MQSEVTKHPLPLEASWVKKGTWMNVSTSEGIGVYLAPLKKVDGKNLLFENLKAVFKHYLIREYQIKDNGEVYFLAPPGFKFGRLLGDIACIYDILYEQEAVKK